MVCLVVVAVPGNRVWSSLVLSIGFGHYVLALWFSRGQLARVASRDHAWIPAVLLVVAATALYLWQFPLIAYFAVHHVLNEVYVSERSLAARGASASWTLTGSAILLNLAIYVAVLRNDERMLLSDPVFAFWFLGVACVPFAIAVLRERRRMSFSQLIDLCLFEAIGLAAAGVTFLVEITFLQVVLYHFVFWIFYPIPRLREHGNPALARYLLTTVAVTGVFLLFSPMGWNREAVWSSRYYAFFVLVSYAHITISFAVSDAQPGWIRRVFKLEPAPV